MGAVLFDVGLINIVIVGSAVAGGIQVVEELMWRRTLRFILVPVCCIIYIALLVYSLVKASLFIGFVIFCGPIVLLGGVKLIQFVMFGDR